jgi:cytoskeletal protein CcmA (bactofilin family)
MLKASSLLYAIFITLIISSVASSFVLFNYYHNIRMSQAEGKLTALNRVESALNLLKVATEEDIIEDETILFDGDLEPTQLQIQPWGAYYLATAKTKFRQNVFQQATLMGFQNLQSYALYLADHNQPLSITGKTRLTGNAMLPKRGLKRAYIEGKSYTGKSLLNGSRKESTGKIPALDPSLTNYLAEQLKEGIPQSVLKVIEYSLEVDENLVQSFQDSTICLYATGKIDLLAGSLRGRIIVKSEREINISNEMELEDVVLIAPKITVQSNFKGTVHLIASDSILVGAFAELHYPSSVMLASGLNQAYIGMGEQAQVFGEVILYGELNSGDNGLLALMDNSVLTGNVYSIDKVELKGKVIGSVTCDKFLLRTSSSIYENHIMDGEINSVELPEHYLGVKQAGSKKSKEIIKWLN